MCTNNDFIMWQKHYKTENKKSKGYTRKSNLRTFSIYQVSQLGSFVRTTTFHFKQVRKQQQQRTWIGIVTDFELQE